MPRFSILTADMFGDWCAVFEPPANLVNRSPLREGERAQDYPARVEFAMAPEKEATAVPDVINNALKLLMVSEKVKRILETHVTGEVEYLPFALRDHKGRIARKNCFIVNPIGTLDVIDRAHSEGVAHPILDGQYQEVDYLVIDESKVPTTTTLFRLATFPSAYFVRDDLRAALEAEGVTGVAWIEQGEQFPL